MTVWTGLKDEWKLYIIENCENKQTNKKKRRKEKGGAEWGTMEKRFGLVRI